MLKRLDECTGSVLGYEVNERITEKEFENLSEEVKTVVAEHGKVRLLVRMNEIPRMGLGAVAEDLKLAPYANDIERYAIVGDASFLEWAESLGDVFISGEITHFEESQYEEAWNWVQAQQRESRPIRIRSSRFSTHKYRRCARCRPRRPQLPLTLPR